MPVSAFRTFAHDDLSIFPASLHLSTPTSLLCVFMSKFWQLHWPACRQLHMTEHMLVCGCSLLCSLDVWILNTCNTVEISPTHLVCSPLLLGFHFSQEAAAHHLHPRVPPATLRTAPAIWTLPGLVYRVWRPRLLRAVGAAATVCVLWAARSVSAVKNQSWSINPG